MMKHLLPAFVFVLAPPFCNRFRCMPKPLPQEWPARPVKVYVPFGPGSTPDMVARLIADRLAQKLGQPFVVEDKPGASATLGTDAVAKAEPTAINARHQPSRGRSPSTRCCFGKAAL